MTERPASDVDLWSPRLDWETRDDGSILISRLDPLGDYPARLNERLIHWSHVAPDRVWMAERGANGNWIRVTYAECLDRVRSIGQYLLEHGLSAERPLAILSENSIAHALMALGAQHAGIPSAAISTGYATLSTDFGKLKDIARQITPGMVFVDDGARFATAIDQSFGAGIPLIVRRNAPARAHVTDFDSVLHTRPSAEIDEAFAATGPDTVAKFLFTSGTTGSPKAVIQTQRMLCANAQMVANCYAFMKTEPPVIVDWAPWNHTASGNKVFNLVIYNGGTFYVDEGKPSPALIGKTIANLREISPSWYFNVPIGYEMLVQAMRKDAALRESFFRRLKLMMYAGAGMAQLTWDALNDLSQQTLGRRVPLGTGMGSTETSPFATFCAEPQETAGNIGVPAQGSVMKLVPYAGKYEMRVKGPHVTPGYWRNPKLTADAFDEEGFYRMGDALRFADPQDPHRGFFFDGRTAENFKLRTGTWVAVGKLRAQLVDQFEGLISDAVIAGENRTELAALVVPATPALRKLINAADDVADARLLAHPKVRKALADRLAAHQRQANGSATRVMRLLLLTEPLLFDRGEVTEKGSVNQRAVLANRPHLVEAVFGTGPDVIRSMEGATI